MKVKLTEDQKKGIIEYLLASCGKGVFEDCPELWNEELDGELYQAYSDAANDFVDEVREYVTQNLI
jgi:hypothetical protein